MDDRDRILTVFLSSTFQDLQTERSAVESVVQRMNAHYVGMEHFGSFGEGPLERCLAKVRASDVLVLVLGCSYGSLPPGSQLSFTANEYAHAWEHDVPVLAYAVDPDDYRIDTSDDRLVDFHREVASRQGVSLFRSAEDLSWKVACDLAREFFSVVTNDAPSVQEFADQLLLSPLEGRVDELILVLEDRARRIRRELHQFYQHAAVSEFLNRFGELHERHIDYLKRRMFIAAHEALIQIHEISYELQRTEFWIRRQGNAVLTRYRVGTESFQRGELICCYVGGEMKADSSSYLNTDGMVVGVADGTRIPPIVTAGLYETILARGGA